MLKVGIIGAGGVARAHARALNTLKNAELVGVLDIDARGGVLRQCLRRHPGHRHRRPAGSRRRRRRGLPQLHTS